MSMIKDPQNENNPPRFVGWWTPSRSGGHILILVVVRADFDDLHWFLLSSTIPTIRYTMFDNVRRKDIRRSLRQSSRRCDGRPRWWCHSTLRFRTSFIEIRLFIGRVRKTTPPSQSRSGSHTWSKLLPKKSLTWFCYYLCSSPAY